MHGNCGSSKENPRISISVCLQTAKLIHGYDNTFPVSPAHQRNEGGASLLEALIGILLVAIMGAGLAHVTAKVLHTQRYATTQNLAVIQLREFLQTGDADEVMIGTQTLSITESPNNPNLAFCIKKPDDSCAADTEHSITSAIPVSRKLTVSDGGLFGGEIKLEH